METTPKKQEFYDRIAKARELPAGQQREALTEIWGEEAAKVLEGCTIVQVRYMTKEEVEDLGFQRAGIVLILDNGRAVFPSRDDEGNDCGALFTTFDEIPTIPVI